jgi:hypothetical protein
MARVELLSQILVRPRERLMLWGDASQILQDGKCAGQLVPESRAALVVVATGTWFVPPPG